MREIVINRMFTGKYLQDNIGHEVINLFKADNGKFYIYLNDIGTIGREHFDAKGNCFIEDMLLVHTLEGVNAVEVLGLAIGLKAVYNPVLSDSDQESNQNKICDGIAYGGANIKAIYRGGAQQQVYVTFEAKDIKMVAKDKRIYLKMADKVNQKHKDIETYPVDTVALLSDIKLGRGLKSYVKEGEADYYVLQKLVTADSLWGESAKNVEASNQPAALSYLDICKKSYDELAYSNAFAYFAKKYPELAFALFDKLTGVKDNYHRDFMVRREDGHIDLLFYNSGHIVVVENKIKSGLNGVEKDSAGRIIKTQLDDYYKEANNLKISNKINCTKPYFFIFAPDYSTLKHYELSHPNPYSNHIRVGAYFDLVFYSEIHQFLLPFLKKKPYENDHLFAQFVNSLERHTHLYDDGEYSTTIRRFYERIECSTVQQALR